MTVEAGNPLLLSSVRNGQLDVIAMNVTAQPYEDIVQDALYVEEFVVYASAAHRLAKRQRVRVTDLVQEEWAFPTLDGAVCKWTHRVFEENGLPPPRVTLMGGPMQIRLQSIGASRLLGLAPRRIVREVASRLRLTEIAVKELVWARHVGVGYRKDAYLSPVARRFIEILKVTAREFAK